MVATVVKTYGLENAVFIGSGMGAQVVLEAVAASIPLAQGILLVGSDAPDAADSAEVLQYYQTADLSGAAQQIKDKLVGSVRGGADSSPAAAVDGAALWRRAVQVIPDAGHNVASEQPAAFDTIVRSFVQDTFAVPSPNLHGETFGTCSGIAAKLPERQRGVMRKEEPGKTHIRARYEPPMEEDLNQSYRSYETTKSPPGSYARGRSPPGSMPHKGARFELHMPNDDEEEHISVMLENPNYKGKVIPGTTPHKMSRFELPTEDLHHDPPSADHRLGVTGNPYHKGRTSPGSMPHRSARFELHIPDDHLAEVAHVPNHGLTATADGVEGGANDQEFRFGGRRVEPGRMAHPNSRFHNNDYGDCTPQTGRLGKVPAGGESTFTFG